MRALIAKFMALPIPGKAMIGMVMAGGVFGLCALAGLTELGYFIGIAMGHPGKDFALLRLAGNDGGVVPQVGQRTLAQIET